MTLKQAAQSALDVQDACNLSGVAHSMLDAIAAIRAEPTNTVQVNQHPIVTLYLLKMNELNGCGSTLHQTYDPAEKACKAIIAAPEVRVCTECGMDNNPFCSAHFVNQ